MKSDTRKQVMAEIIRVMVDATLKGDSAYEAALEAFPGVPTSILGEALAEADDIYVEAWWQTIERTIDGEVIRNTLTSKSQT